MNLKTLTYSGLILSLFMLGCSSSINESKIIDNRAENKPAQIVGSEDRSPVAIQNALRTVQDILIAPIDTDPMAKGLVVSDSQAQKIEEQFLESFRLTSKIDVYNLKTLPKVPFQTQKNVTGSSVALPEAKVIALAKENGISSVLFIRVTKIQERTGSSFGANKLASLGLTAQIYNTKTSSGQDIPVWRSGYSYSDNAKPLISFEDGKLAKLGFKSVDDLVKEASEQIAGEFSAARQKSFAK